MTAPTTTAAGVTPGRPARPGGADYWQRIARIVDQAPPLSDEQRVAIRLAIWGTVQTRAEAA